MARPGSRAGRQHDGRTRPVRGDGRTATARAVVPPARLDGRTVTAPAAATPAPPHGRTAMARAVVPPARLDGRTGPAGGTLTRIQGDGRAARPGGTTPARTGHGSQRIQGDGRGRRIGARARAGGCPRIHGDGRGRLVRGAGQAGGSARIHGDGHGRGSPGTGPARPGGHPRDARPPDRDGGREGTKSGRLRTPLRLATRATRRFARTAGQAALASVATGGVATADPRTRTVPVRAARPAPRWRYAARSSPGASVLVIGTLMLLIIAMLGVERTTGVTVLPDRLFAGLRPPPKKFPVLAASPPTDLAIGKLGLRAPVHRVGIASDGTIAVPPLERADEAGWYEQGPTPGQNGPAVIVGHVDTTTGPAVFHDLRKLDDGDRVEVTREDRSVAVFEVTSVERYGKERLPVKEIFGDFSRPNLRLITCGGRWVGGETGYADNLVVYASLVQARGP